MNAKQMKQKIRAFRTADVSIIKDDALRAKAQTLQAKQKGFTLLELLVVITLLATLATAALVAYDGIGENASDTAAANSLLAAESALRNYRAVENAYPTQWDNLATLGGVALIDTSGAVVPETTGALLAKETRDFFGQLVVGVTAANTTGSIFEKVAQALDNVGVSDFQTIDASGAIPADSIPNLSFNESGNKNGSASELVLIDDVLGTVDITWDTNAVVATGGKLGLSIVPSFGINAVTDANLGCVLGAAGPDLTTSFSGTAVADSSALNLINDAIANTSCTLVIAAGYGKDVPGTTINSRVAIAQVPTVGTKNVNPATSYARAIALFQVAEDGSDGSTPNGVIDKAEVFAKARLIGVVDPEGRAIDSVLAAANAKN